MILSAVLSDAHSRKLHTREEIAELIAYHSTCFPLPDDILNRVHGFVYNYLNEQIGAKAANDAESVVSYMSDVNPICYYVFHDGDYHFYAGQLPEKIQSLKKKLHVWGNLAQLHPACPYAV